MNAEKNPFRWRLLTARCVLVIVALAAAIIAAEVSLRLSEPHVIQQDASPFIGEVFTISENIIYSTRKGRRLRPHYNVKIKNHFVSKLDIIVETNSLGFRDKELAGKNPADKLRILALGDSITLVPICRPNRCGSNGLSIT